MSRKKRPQKTNKHSGSNILRIIGGQWRSRKLQFTDAPGLRPTPDRIRETLFNWLQADIHSAVCLDLFAGSGALGFEALSRGAQQLVFVEKDKKAASQLEANLKLLNAAEAEVHCLDALEYLQGDYYKKSKKGGCVLDIVFLDPPYRKGLLDKSLKLLKEKGLIDQHSLIYLEHEAEESFEWANYGLSILKESSAGQVKSYLLGQSS